MSDFDNFDIHQMSLNFAQRQYFIRNFYCKKISILGSLNDAENENLHFFIVHPIFHHQYLTSYPRLSLIPTIPGLSAHAWNHFGMLWGVVECQNLVESNFSRWCDFFKLDLKILNDF